MALRTLIVSAAGPESATAIAHALRGLGHEPVAWICPPGPPEQIAGCASGCPEGVDFLVPASRASMLPLTRAHEPDLLLCWGFPWLLSQDVLDVARLGSINGHTSALPRHRGGHPWAWAVREGDPEFAVTIHRMSASFDTGAILAQGFYRADDAFQVQELIGEATACFLSLLEPAIARVEAGDPGDEQEESQASWAGAFGEDYVYADLAMGAEELHRRTRAWRLLSQHVPLRGPIVEIDGEQVRLRRTALADPGGGARRVETADGPLWILEEEPAF